MATLRSLTPVALCQLSMCALRFRLIRSLGVVLERVTSLGASKVRPQRTHVTATDGKSRKSQRVRIRPSPTVGPPKPEPSGNRT